MLNVFIAFFFYCWYETRESSVSSPCIGGNQAVHQVYTVSQRVVLHWPLFTVSRIAGTGLFKKSNQNIQIACSNLPLCRLEDLHPSISLCDTVYYVSQQTTRSVSYLQQPLTKTVWTQLSNKIAKTWSLTFSLMYIKLVQSRGDDTRANTSSQQT